MTHLAGRESLGLRIREADRDPAGGKIPASVAMILLARAGDVHGLGLLLLLGRCSLRTNRTATGQTSEMQRARAASKRRMLDLLNRTLRLQIIPDAIRRLVVRIDDPVVRAGIKFLST